MAEKATPPSMAEYQADFLATTLPLVGADELIALFLSLKPGQSKKIRASISMSEYAEVMNYVSGRRANGVPYELSISNDGIVVEYVKK